MNKRLHLRLALTACLLLLAMAHSSRLHAWQGASPSKAAEGTTVYLYNVGARQWLNASGAWGAQPCLYDVGMPLTLTAQGTAFSIQGDVKNPYFADYLTVQSDGCWWDQSLKDGSRWTFTAVTTSPAVYTLSATTDGTTYFLRWNGTDRIAEWSTALTATTAARDAGAQWQIVTLAELTDALATATPSEGRDATFFIKDQNFVFNGKNRSAWTWASTSANHFIGINGNDENAASDAQYYNGEVWQDANTISQTLTGLPRGTYVLSAQALYRDGNATPAAEARLTGTEQIRAFLFAGSNEQPLMSIFDEAGHYPGSLGLATVLGQVPDTRTQAGQYFMAGLYGANHVAFYVGADGSSISIGLRKEAGTADWMAFDNFRLAYYGPDDATAELQNLYEGYDLINPRDFVLDEDSTSFDNLTSYSHRRLLMRRTMDLDQWNSLILPVDLSYEQFAHTFGSDARLAQLVGPDPADPNNIIFRRIEPREGRTALHAGSHYLIRPTQAPDVAATDSYRRADGSTISGPLYVVENVSMHAGEFIVDSLYANSDYSQGLYMMGTYYKRDGLTALNPKIPAGSYAFAHGDLYHIATAQTLRAFRCWLEDMEGTTTQAKALRISVMDDLPTGIEEVKTERLSTEIGNSSLGAERGEAYDLTGRRLPTFNARRPALPRGLYIVDGRKVFIR